MPCLAGSQYGSVGVGNDDLQHDALYGLTDLLHRGCQFQLAWGIARFPESKVYSLEDSLRSRKFHAYQSRHECNQISPVYDDTIKAGSFRERCISMHRRKIPRKRSESGYVIRLDRSFNEAGHTNVKR